MDIELARTFLEIVTAGSFVRAAERLNVTQTTVSARIRSLEDQLGGRPLFIRNKAGATMTPAGEQFLRYAPTLLQVWERARHQVAVPPGHRAVLAIGGELSLWNPLLLRWSVWMRRLAPDVALRIHVRLPEALMDQVAAGVLDIALMYAPQVRAGTRIELLIEEKLALVTTAANPDRSLGADYVYVDWGPDFALHHNLNFPDRTNPGLFMGLGPLGLSYILEAGGSGYFRIGAVKPYLKSGQLRLVPGAPEFLYPAYAVYSAHGDADLVRRALDGLRHIALEESEA
jgi:LysR family transcriptional regulator, flagellar master operon regulator